LKVHKIAIIDRQTKGEVESEVEFHHKKEREESEVEDEK